MKTSALFVSLFALGALAAAVPVEREDVGGVAEIMAGRAVDNPDEVDTIFYGTCAIPNGGNGICNYGEGTKPCGVNYKCSGTGHACKYNTKGTHAHCNI